MGYRAEVRNTFVWDLGVGVGTEQKEREGEVGVGVDKVVDDSTWP